MYSKIGTLHCGQLNIPGNSTKDLYIPSDTRYVGAVIALNANAQACILFGAASNGSTQIGIAEMDNKSGVVQLQFTAGQVQNIIRFSNTSSLSLAFLWGSFSAGAENIRVQ